MKCTPGLNQLLFLIQIRLVQDGGLIRVNEKIASDSFDDSNRDRSKLVSVTPVSR